MAGGKINESGFITRIISLVKVVKMMRGVSKGELPSI
jgi:hypothetical protein